MKLRIPQATGKGYIEVKPYGAFDWSYPSSKTRRGRVQGGAKFAQPYYAQVKYMYLRDEADAI